MNDSDLILKEFNGWPVGFRQGDSSPLVRDIELGERLGYDRPRDIRPLIERMIAAGQLGPVYKRDTASRYEIRPGVWHPGQAAAEYWLTEAQALKVAARSETEVADVLLDEVIAVYMAARRGELPQQAAAPALPTSDALRRAELTAEGLRGMGEHINSVDRAAVSAYIIGFSTGMDPKRLLPVQEERWKRPTEIEKDLGASRYEVSTAIKELGLKERKDLSRIVRDVRTSGVGGCDCYEYNEQAVEMIREYIAAHPYTPKRATKKKAAPASLPALVVDATPANDAPEKADETAA